MLDQSVRQLVDERMQVYSKAHTDLITRVETIMVGPFVNLDERVSQIELSVYGKNSQENKLDLLRKEISNFEQQLHLSNQARSNVCDLLSQKSSKLEFDFAILQKLITRLEANISECKLFSETQSANVNETLKKQSNMICSIDQ